MNLDGPLGDPQIRGLPHMFSAPDNTSVKALSTFFSSGQFCNFLSFPKLLGLSPGGHYFVLWLILL